MNFQELLSKMSELDRPVGEAEQVSSEACGLPPPSLSGMSDMPGGMMGMRSGTPPQPDSINANVSLNASGKGGIKDLMDILRNIEGGKEDGKFDMPMAISLDDLSKEEFVNEPDEMYQDIDAVTQTGGDLHSKGIEKRAVAGGGNPMAVESLKERLQAQYNKIKEG